VGNTVESINPELREFISQQRVFFVATAPLSPAGHVNLSPKGMDSFRVLAPTRVVYLDLTGSGNETAAHLLENGRITFMFCAFEGRPKILRLYGTGRVVLPETSEWAQIAGEFPDYPGVRQIVVTEVSRIQTSCGFGVPLLAYAGDRDNLIRWAEAKGDALPGYRAAKNAVSIDGLPAPSAGGESAVGRG
jgi:hypothetical protein